MGSPFDELHTHTADVYGPPASSEDAGGGVQVAWPTVRQAGIACRVNVPGYQAQDRFSQDNLIGTVQVTTTYLGTQRGDLLVVSGGALDGVRLRVVGLMVQPASDVTGVETFARISCERVV